MSWPLWTFVSMVVAVGVLVLARATAALPDTTPNLYAAVLAALTLVSGRIRIKVPGRPASVSVSEVFVFTSVVLFGPAIATLTVAVDGLLSSVMQKNRRLYRGLFNIAEPAISTWVSGCMFFFAAGAAPDLGVSGLMVPTVAMASTYFVLNSCLQAIAVALENHVSAYETWRRHALYLGMYYYAGASLASLSVRSNAGIDFGVIGLVAPLLVLSYIAYKTAAHRVEDSERHSREVEHLYQAAVETLAIAVDAKDQVTHGHIRRVQRHTLAVARAMGVNAERELKALEAASLLHDVGKLAVPDYVLNKPGALSAAEFERIKLHASKGAEILTTVDFPYPVVPIVRHHHEQWDGRGYPDGISGESIPLGARILSVVDCFDALTSDRPYRRKLSDEEAVKIVRSRSGVSYDPAVVDAFVALIPELRRGDLSMEVPPQETLSSVVDSRVHVPPPRNTGGGDVGFTLLSALGPHFADKIGELLPDVEYCLFTPDVAGEFLVVAHATPMVDTFVQSLRLRVGEGLSGWVAANRHTIVNSPPDLDLGDAALHIGLRSAVSTIVYALGNLVGVLTVYSSRPNGFSNDDVRLIGALAQELGLEIARTQIPAVSRRELVPADKRGGTAVL
jgi:putative nucleotidyltransferase with HDIG domain